jgi:hypothetical protein
MYAFLLLTLQEDQAVLYPQMSCITQLQLVFVSGFDKQAIEQTLQSATIFGRQ